MKKLRLLFVLTALVFFTLNFIPSLAGAQASDWKIYKPTNTGIQGNYVYSIAFQGNDMWVAANDPIWDEGGISKFDGTKWTNYSSVDNAMPSFEANKIFIRPNGEKWISTSNGLVVKNSAGVTTAIYNSSNTPFPSNLIGDIEEDAQGNIWVTVGHWYLNQPGGIAKFNGTTWQMFSGLFPGNPQVTPSNLYFDNTGKLWVGWITGGVSVFNGTTWQYFEPSYTTYRGGTSTGISGDTQGNLWFTTDNNGFGKYTPSANSWQWWTRDDIPALGTDGFSEVINSNDGSVYLTTYTGRVFKFNGSIQQNYLWHGSHIYTFAFGPDGGIWVGGIGGVEKLTGANPVTYSVANTGLPERWYNQIVIDKDNNKWISMPGGGLSMLNSNNSVFRDFNPYNFGHEPWPFPTDVSSQALFDKFGNTWAGMDGGGVGKWDGTGWTRYEAGLTANWIISIGMDSSQHIWAGVYNWGVGRLDGSTFTMFNMSNSGIGNNYIYSIATAADGTIWFGTGYGLSKFSNNQWITYRTDNSGIPGNTVNDIKFDNAGNMWLATDGGVAKFNGTTWQSWSTANANIPASYINAVAIAPDGNIWIGCFQGSTFPYTGGIAKFDGLSWTSWTTANSPLPHNQVETINFDKLGNLWIGTASEGIAVFHEGGIITGVNNNIITQSVPGVYNLRQNYPNPFNPVTKINFTIPVEGNVKLTVFDITGREVASLLNGYQSAGDHTISFDGSQLTSGIYFYRLESGSFTETKKMVLTK
jgi:ligand-binding sensor domain-containing protein